MEFVKKKLIIFMAPVCQWDFISEISLSSFCVVYVYYVTISFFCACFLWKATFSNLGGCLGGLLLITLSDFPLLLSLIFYYGVTDFMISPPSLHDFPCNFDCVSVIVHCLD